MRVPRLTIGAAGGVLVDSLWQSGQLSRTRWSLTASLIAVFRRLMSDFSTVFGEVLRVVVHVVKIVLELAVLCDPFGKGSTFPASISARTSFLADHVFDRHVLVFDDETALSSALVCECVDFTLAAASKLAVLHAIEHNHIRLWSTGRRSRCSIIFVFQFGSVRGFPKLGLHHLGTQFCSEQLDPAQVRRAVPPLFRVLVHALARLAAERPQLP